MENEEMEMGQEKRKYFFREGGEEDPSLRKENFLRNKMETKERIVEEREEDFQRMEEKEEKKERERFLERGEEINPSQSKIYIRIKVNKK